MGKIELNNFTLEEYDKTNKDHYSTIIKLGNDLTLQSYLGDMQFFIDNLMENRIRNNFDQIYIIYRKDTPLGFISLSDMHNEVEVCYGILSEFRMKGIATAVLKEFSNYLFKNNKNLRDLFLFINKENKASIQVARKSGFTKINSIKYILGR